MCGFRIMKIAFKYPITCIVNFEVYVNQETVYLSCWMWRVFRTYTATLRGVWKAGYVVHSPVPCIFSFHCKHVWKSPVQSSTMILRAGLLRCGWSTKSQRGGEWWRGLSVKTRLRKSWTCWSRQTVFTSKWSLWLWIVLARWPTVSRKEATVLYVH